MGLDGVHARAVGVEGVRRLSPSLALNLSPLSPSLSLNPDPLSPSTLNLSASTLSLNTRLEGVLLPRGRRGGARRRRRACGCR